MVTGDEPNASIGEDELLLTDMEGPETTRAAAALGRARRWSLALERRGQLQRICEVFRLGESDAYDDVRLRLLYRVIGDVHEQIWRDALAALRLQVADEADRTWREELLTADPDRPDPVALNEEALFMPDARAVAGMTHRRQQAIGRANDYLRATCAGMVAVEQCTFPNPYQDLWVVDPVEADPARRGEPRQGGFLVVVPAVGDVYPAGAGASPRPAEVVGMIGPPDDEWDDLSEGRGSVPSRGCASRSVRVRPL